MNNPWAYSIIVLALVTMAIARHLPRAWFWIGIGGASFVVTSLFWDITKPYPWVNSFHPIIVFACDAAVCICVSKWAKETWEFGIFAAFFVACFCSLLKLGTFIPEGIMYASFLELCNFCALLWIGGIGILDRVGKHEGGFVHSVHRHLHHPRDSL